MEQTENRGLERERGSTWWRHARATRLGNVAVAHSTLQSFDAANTAVQGAIDTYAALEQAEPENITWPVNRAAIMVDQAGYQRQIDGIEGTDIDALYIRAFELAQDLADREPGRIEPFNTAMYAYYGRGDLYREYGIYDTAYELFEGAMSIWELRQNKFPEYHRSEQHSFEIVQRLGLSASEQAEAALRQKDPKQAELWARRALDHRADIIGYRAELAHALMLQGDHQGASELYASVDGPIGFGTMSWTDYLTTHLTMLRELGYADDALAPLIRFLGGAQ